jgi:hypothetical protein
MNRKLDDESVRGDGGLARAVTGTMSIGRMFVAAVALANLGAGGDPPLAQGSLGVKDADFWDDAGSLEERMLERLEDKNLSGLVLDGPRRAPLGRRDGIPLICAHASITRDHLAMSVDRHGVIVATRLETGETYAARATAQRNPEFDGPSEPLPPRDPATVPQGRSISSFTLALDEQIPEVLSRSGTWATAVLLFNLRSNQVVTRVVPPASKRELAAERPSKKALASIEAQNLACSCGAECPLAPQKSSVVLASAGPEGQGASRKWMVHGRFRLPLSSSDVLPDGGLPSTRKESTARGPSGPGPGTFIPVTLVLTGAKDATPIVLPLRVPVQEATEPRSSQGPVEGCFSVDLLALRPKLRPQTYAVWAISRRQLAGPTVVRLAQP